MLGVLVVVALTLAALAALVLVRPELVRGAALVDPAGIRSTLVVRVATERKEDGEPAPSPELLESIVHGLETAGAETSHWHVVGSVLELEGMLGADSFRVTIGPLDPTAFMLVVHGRALGRTRWVAPPATASMRTVLLAVDRGARSAPGVLELGWRQRQDDPGGPGVWSTPVD